jgi:hypothetical protein
MGDPGAGDLTLKFFGDAGVVGRADIVKDEARQRSDEREKVRQEIRAEARGGGLAKWSRGRL